MGEPNRTGRRPAGWRSWPLPDGPGEDDGDGDAEDADGRAGATGLRRPGTVPAGTPRAGGRDPSREAEAGREGGGRR